MEEKQNERYQRKTERMKEREWKKRARERKRIWDKSREMKIKKIVKKTYSFSNECRNRAKQCTKNDDQEKYSVVNLKKDFRRLSDTTDQASANLVVHLIFSIYHKRIRTELELEPIVIVAPFVQQDYVKLYLLMIPEKNSIK